MENNVWRIRYNEEINALLKRDRVRFVKSQRLKWFGHVKRMEDNAMPKRTKKGNCIPKEEKGDLA
jgi:hypothetical protein